MVCSGFASGFGGAIGSFGDSLTVINSTFLDNFASSGGAIYYRGMNNPGVTSITGSTFQGNSVLGHGGALEIIGYDIQGDTTGGLLTIDNSVFDNNTAVGAGAAVILAKGTISNSSFTNNIATDHGGALLLGSTDFDVYPLNIVNTTIEGNQARSGGAIYSQEGVINIDRSTISNNVSTGIPEEPGDYTGGGGIFLATNRCYALFHSAVTLSNSTISNNSAYNGGGVYYLINNQTLCNPSIDPLATLVNTTVANNLSTNQGSGVYFTLTFDAPEPTAPWMLNLSNTVVSNPGSADNCFAVYGTPLVDGGNNLQFPSSSCGATIPVADPLLTPLADNGGPTFTMMPQAGSPVLDAGNNAICAATPVNNLDQRGITRPIGPSCDIGATEGIVGAANSLPVVADVTLNPSPAAINTTVTATGTFTDVDQTNTHTAVWNWGDGITTNGTVTETNGSGTVSGTHSYSTVGVYTVTLTVTDNATGVGSAFQYVTVYNPFTGDVAGSGKYNSPAGALVSDPQATGQVRIGFSSKYINGGSIPIGNTKLTFKSANFDFDSSSYEWLVVDGAKGQYRGTGTVNGVAGYTFLVTVIDGDVAGGGGVDKFRIKIWNTATSAVVYDTQMGDPDSADPTMTLQQGHIAIHP